MNHGSANCYQSGCRLPDCRLAHKIAMSRYRAAREQRGGTITEHGIIGGELGVPVDTVGEAVGKLIGIILLAALVAGFFLALGWFVETTARAIEAVL